MISDRQPAAGTSSALPYTDAKPVGAADFYFAINTTFRFIEQKLGRDGILRYWKDLGTRYFAPVTKSWVDGGLDAVAAYWRAFFDAEPDADVAVEHGPDRVTLTVRQCPAIYHLRRGGRDIVPDFCEHCYWVSDAIGKPAGLTVRIAGGNGSCRQDFLKAGTAPEQNLNLINRCS